MRRFSFSLKHVLAFKVQTRQQIERQLAVKRQEHELMCKKVSVLEERLESESRMSTSTTARTQVISTEEIGRFLNHLKNTIALHKSLVTKLAQECKAIMKQHEKLAGEIEAMQSLRSQQLSAFRSKHKKDEQGQLTDMIVQHWSAKSEVFEDDD